jgi:hypothetical protein
MAEFTVSVEMEIEGSGPRNSDSGAFLASLSIYSFLESP